MDHQIKHMDRRKKTYGFPKKHIDCQKKIQIVEKNIWIIEKNIWISEKKYLREAVFMVLSLVHGLFRFEPN